jgi:hypothetical protein
VTITALTCTADRPEAFALLERYMTRQTVKPNPWIVLDDGNVPVKPTLGQRHVYCPECRGGTSMINKLKIAFAPGFITTDIVVIIEDDDWVAPTWIETCVKNLTDGKCDLFGEGRAVYYNVRDRWWFEHGNMNHASLCSTAFTKRLYPLVHQLCNDPNPFIDDRLWKKAPTNRKRVLDPGAGSNKRQVVGIKAMPGKVGYGGGHAKKDPNAKQDPNGAQLIKLIGTDCSLYEEFWSGYVAPVNLRVPVHTETGRVHGPNWLKHLSHLIGQPNITGLEIGTFRGDSAEFLCENVFFHDTARYYCVDPFTGSIEHKEAGIDCTTLESDSRARLAQFPQVQFIKEYSNRALRRFNLELDWAYVDGAHDAMNCLRDAVLVFDALKIGGLMCFDDVLWEVHKHELDRPKMAVDAFMAIYKRQVEIVMHGGWQTILKKIAE